MRFGRNAGVCIADMIAACVLPFLFVPHTRLPPDPPAPPPAPPVPAPLLVLARQSAAASSAPSPNMAVRQSALW